jgi:hypothetical protein
MPTTSSIQVVHRYFPAMAIWGWCAIAVALLAGVWVCLQVPGNWEVEVALWSGLVLLAIRIGFLRAIIVLADDGHLTVIRRPLIRLFGTFAVYPREGIRRIRYRLEMRERNDGSGDAGTVDHYILDMVTTDSEVVTLIDSEINPLPRMLGKKLATALNVSYEEYL